MLGQPPFRGGAEAHLRVPLLLWVACRKVVVDTLAGHVERNSVTLGARPCPPCTTAQTAIDADHPPHQTKFLTVGPAPALAISRKSSNAFVSHPRHRFSCFATSAAPCSFQGPAEMVPMSRATNQAECTLPWLRGQRLLTTAQYSGSTGCLPPSRSVA